MSSNVYSRTSKFTVLGTIGSPIRNRCLATIRLAGPRQLGPYGIDPKEWAESLSSAAANFNEYIPGALCKAVRNWLTVHYPDLMDTIRGEEAALLSEGVEGMV